MARRARSEPNPHLGALRERLSAAGLDPGPDGVHTVALEGGELLGWVGLELSGRDPARSIAVTPMIGVYDAAIAEQLVELADLTAQPLGPPLLLVRLDELAGHGEPWLLEGSRSAPVDARIAEMVDAVAGPGLAWMRERCTFERLLAAFERGEGDPWTYPLTVPLVLDRLGRRADALAYLDRIDALEFEVEQTWAREYVERVRRAWGQA